MATDETLELTVPPTLAGQRLDRALGQVLRFASRTALAAAIAAGRVTLDGRSVRPAARLRVGSRVRIVWRKTGRDAEAPLAPPPAVLYDDADFLVVDKPAGMPVAPTSTHFKNTVLTRLATGAAPLRLCHRLDRETSGVLALGRTLAGVRCLTRQLAARTVEKRYLALVSEPPGEPSFAIDAPVSGRPARTECRCLGRTGLGWLMELRPQTGRRHQLRVHLASLGLPIVGDARYGGRPHGRLLLHACELTFTDVAGHRRSVVAPVPAELGLPPPADLPL